MAQMERSDALLHFFSDTTLYLDNHLPYIYQGNSNENIQFFYFIPAPS